MAVSASEGVRYPVRMNENASTSDDPPLPPLVRFRRYLWQLVVRIVIYVLIYLAIAIVTIGPCFWYWFEATYVNGAIWVAKFYAPLLWLCDRIWPLGWFVNHYINWWIK
jgi:hypothetical protein